MKNEELVDFFLDNLRFERRLSKHTITAYQTDLQQFSAFLVGAFDEVNLAELSFAEIRAWVVSLSEDKISSRSINRKMASLRSFYSYLLKNKKVESDPTLKLRALKTSSTPPEFIEEKATAKLFEEIDFPASFDGSRDRLILMLLYGSGIRLAELISLKMNQVDIDEQKFTVLGKRNKLRLIPLPASIIPFLKDYLDERSKIRTETEQFFIRLNGKELYPQLVQRTVKKYLSMVTSQKKNSPHILRHTYATHLLNNGADLNAIKDLLGHSSLAATQVYTHNSIEKLKEVHRKAHPKSK